MLVRKPHVAGTFYPADPTEIREFCWPQLKSERPLIRAKAVILPHAGYIYSCKTACRVLSRVVVPNVNFLIGPNHSGYGKRFALMAEGSWLTPMGEVPIHGPMARHLLEKSDCVTEDDTAHLMEHSLEVEVPLLQLKNPGVKIIPLIVGTMDLKLAGAVARDIADCISEFDQEILLVISTDMNHYEDDSATRKKDRYALTAIENLDAGALVRAIGQHQISMCGFVPVYMVLLMAEKLGIRKAELVDYTTSAEASGDTSRVVGYAGFILE